MAETYWERKLWEPHLEAMPRGELKKLQEERLRRQLVYAYEHAPLYKELYDKEKVDVYKIKTVEEFQRYVPVVSKDTLREYRERTGDVFGGVRCLPFTVENYFSHPNIAYVGLSPVVAFAGMLHRSTGTSGEPTWFMISSNDQRIYANLYARSFWRQLVRPGDFIIHPGGGLLEWHGEAASWQLASHQIGAFTFYMNMLNPDADFNLLLQLEKQGIHINYFFLLAPAFRWLRGKMEAEGTNLKRDYFSQLRSVLISNELSKSCMDDACERFGVVGITESALTEAMLTVGGCGCDWEEGQGAREYAHLPEDTHFFEVIPLGKEEPVKEAEFGEAVVTNLFSESMAYIRFRWDDIGRFKYEPCPYCGTTFMSMWPRCRTSEVVNIKGKYILMGDVEEFVYVHPEI